MSNLAPFFSIIVAVRNGSKTLQKCIDSVANQTYQDRELIIIDGNSNDGTYELLIENKNKIGYFVSEPDNGIYGAWNKGLIKTKGNWICFLGADDFFLDDFVLERVSSELQKIPRDILLVYGQVLLVDGKDKPIFKVGKSWADSKELFLKGLPLPHQGVMHHHTLFEKNGFFDDTFKICADYELTLRELKLSKAYFLQNIVVAAMRQGGVSSHISTSVNAIWEIRRAQKMHGIGLSFFWVLALTKVYLRVILWMILKEKLSRKLFDLFRRIRGLPLYWSV